MSITTQDRGNRFTIGIGNRYDSFYLRNGTIKIDGFDADFPAPPGREEAQPLKEKPGDPEYVAPSSMFTAMATNPIYDIGELALSTYFQAVDFGKEITALPVFPSRFFPHSQISVNVNAGIGTPADLEGKRVCTGSFSKNYAVWLRGILRHQYDVPVEKIIWVENQPEHFSEYRAPARYIVEKLPAGQSPSACLEAGAIQALVAPRGPQRNQSPVVKALFENPYAEIRRYVEVNAFFPINTVITVPKATLKKSPAFSEAVFTAFQRALRLYRNEVKNGARDDEHSGLALKKLEAEAGVTLPDYGLRQNRENIRTMIQYCYEQGVIRKLYTPEELFLLPDS
jgi:4,5-dihydroxyphthalate decarboxylase